MPLNPGTRLGPYEILEPIGAGGMGEVYRARDERLSRDVAVKVLPPDLMADPDRLARFEQEARAAGQLNHPNIVVVYDTGTHEGIPYVVQELLEGRTLRAVLDGEALPPRKALDFAAQIARGLAPAHQKGIVHRDLKPENLFVTDDGRVKILDFGLAKLALPADADPALSSASTQARTEAGVILGTVGYMSPEQVRGRDVDSRSDIFSFGAILHEMLTGQRAFRGDSAVETMNAILQSEPPAPSLTNPEIPQSLDRILLRCLEKSPDQRFQSASDMAFQLETTSAASGGTAAAGLRPRAARPAVRLAVGVLAVLIPLALAAAFIAGRRTHPEAGSPSYTQLTFRQGSIFSARFTPDGQTVIYGASWDGAPTELFSARRGSLGSRPLGVPDADLLAVSGSGELAVLLHPVFTYGWVRRGTLARVPLAGGPPREVLEDVQDAEWSPDGERLAVVRSSGGRQRLEFPIGRILFETDGWISSPRISRDGTTVAFLHHPLPGDNRGGVRIATLDGDGRDLTELFGTATGLVWSPSQEEIWFTAGTSGTVGALYGVDLDGDLRLIDRTPSDLVLRDVSSDGDVLLVRNIGRRGMIVGGADDDAERDLSHLDWSRPSVLSDDGRWVLFEEQGQGGGPGYTTYLRPTDGSPPVRLGKGIGCALSPDGDWVLTLRVEEPRRLELVPRRAGEARELDIPGMRIRAALGWVPDGRHILVYGSEADRPSRFFVVDASGGTPRPVTPEGTRVAGAISPDGELIAAPDADGRMWIHPIAGGEGRPVDGALQDDVPLRFASDGTSLFVATMGRLSAQVERIDLGTGARSTVFELTPRDRAGLLDVGFVAVSADARSYVYSYRRVLSTLYAVEGLR